MNWFPIFYREILRFQRRLLRLGYVLGVLFTPLLYLLAFGLGLGKRVTIPGTSYLDYLLPGLIAMSSMTNAYLWVALGLTVGRLYYRTFQVYVQAPVTAGAIVVGQILSGVVRGLFASLLLLLLGLLLGSRLQLNFLFILTLILNSVLFAALGVIVGMKSRSEEDTSTFTNFLIMPMAFFCGTFFLIDEMPWWLQVIIKCLPLTHTNHLLRFPTWTIASLDSLIVLTAYVCFAIVLGIIIVRRYSE
ncbi:MAG: ABC transporter permease [Thermodesulfobacteriota bacterium]